MGDRAPAGHPVLRAGLLERNVGLIEDLAVGARSELAPPRHRLEVEAEHWLSPNQPKLDRRVAAARRVREVRKGGWVGGPYEAAAPIRPGWGELDHGRRPNPVCGRLTDDRVGARGPLIGGIVRVAWVGGRRRRDLIEPELELVNVDTKLAVDREG